MQQAAEQTEKMARQASPRVNSNDLPIRSYDDLSGSEASQRLDGLSNDDLKRSASMRSRTGIATPSWLRSTRSEGRLGS